MHVLITGGCGFVGHYLAKSYLQEDHKVTIVDNLSHGGLLPRDLNHKKAAFLKLNLSAPSNCAGQDFCDALMDCDLVYHLASSIGVKRIDQNPGKTLLNSMWINHNLFPVFEKYNKKVVFTSSSEVYGDNDNAKENDVLRIGPPDRPRWGYACNKLMSEFLIRSYSFPSVVARLFNVTGRGHKEMVLPLFVEKAKKNQDLTVFGDGKQFRSFCDIRDAVSMLRLLGEEDRHNGEIYNIGNPKNTVTIKELAEIVIGKAKSNSEIVFRPYQKEFSVNHADIIQRRVNTDKIGPFYKCKYSLTDTVDHMLMN